MFNKKECQKCGKKIDKKYDFCPYCGKHLNESPENWGMLGKNDSPDFFPFQNSLLRGIGGGILNKMLGSAMKMLEKEMQREVQKERQNLNQPKTNFQLFINGKRINLKENPKVKRKNPQRKKINFLPSFSESKSKNTSKLPRKEPKTNIRRFSDKIVYEIEMPGVKSIKDISIVKLENSIEIKSFTKNKSYFKSIPISLPIIDYELSNEKLILELEGK